MSKKNALLRNKSGEKYFKVFFAAFLIFFITLLPILIYNKGIFLYYGDYNAQQIPFSYMLHKTIRAGEFGWNWFTDLGSDLMTSYSFYLFSSPFFWLSIPLPNSLAIYAMPILLCLKTGVAAVTAYAYIRRFVKSPDAAFVGALLYAFSGFQMYNIFFNHFHDVTALFPLMLIAMEERINNDRKGVFALTVALLGITNYFFFTGQAVFLMLYYICRCRSKDFKTSLVKFLSLCFEAILGAGMAAFILLPSAQALLGNYRIDERLYGLDMAVYNDEYRILRILQSFFMPPDVPARPNLFSSNSAKWSSIGGYLPLFSLAGVISFMRAKKKHWATSLTLLCTFMAFVPILNSAFYAFNSSYYARWYYMPILIMAMMTAYSLDNRKLSMKTGVKCCFFAIAFFAAIGVLPRMIDGEKKWFKIPEYPFYFWLSLALGALLLVLLIVLLKARKNNPLYLKSAVAMTITACLAVNFCTVYYCVSAGPYPYSYISKTIDNIGGFELDDEGLDFYRIDTDEGSDNYPMLWGYPTIRCFQSVVCTSIMEFYDSIGVQRDVASRPETSVYGIRGLLSVKYYFEKTKLTPEEIANMKTDYSSADCELPGFVYYGTQGGYDIYENENYLPMGFTYDYYIPHQRFESKSSSTRNLLLMKAIVLDDEQIAEYGDILEVLPDSKYTNCSENAYYQDCLDRSETVCYDFEYSSKGFSAKIDLSSDELVFFSVPYSKGFSATINGSEAKVEKVSNGLMAVRVPAGQANSIVFEYETPGLKLGLLISAVSLLLLCLYVMLFQIFRKRRKKTAVFSHSYDYSVEGQIKAQNAYIKSLVSGFEKRLALNTEQPAADEPEEVDEDITEQTDADEPEEIDEDITEQADADEPEEIDEDITEQTDADEPKEIDEDITEQADADEPKEVDEKITEQTDADEPEQPAKHGYTPYRAYGATRYFVDETAELDDSEGAPDDGVEISPNEESDGDNYAP